MIASEEQASQITRVSQRISAAKTPSKDSATSAKACAESNFLEPLTPPNPPQP